MASYEEVMTALRNAHDAGDEEAATRLAGIAQGLKTTSSVQDPVAGIPGSENRFTEHDYSKDESPLDTYVRGPIEAAAQFATSIPIGLTAPIAGFVKKGLNPDSNKTADQLAGEFMQDYTYAPRGSAGQRYGEELGKVVNDVGIPLAGLHGLPRMGQQFADHSGPSVGTVLRDLMGGKEPTSTVKSALDDLNAPEASTATPEVPITDTRSGLAKSKEAYQAALREQELQRQSAFNRPEQLGNLEAESPMNRMARDLGAEPAKVEPPMSRMAQDLTAERSNPEQRAAQNAVEQRNGGIDAEMQQRLADEARIRQEADWRQQANKGTQSDSMLAEQAARKQATEEAARAADQPPVELPKGKTTLEPGVEFSVGPDGRLFIKKAEPASVEPLKPTTMETAVDKVANGQQFAMSAEERVIWEKTRKAVESLGDGIRRLSNKEIVSKMQDRAWVQDAVDKIKQQRAMFDEIAQRSQDRQAVNQAIKKRELLDDHLATLEETLTDRPDNAGKVQGPKTQAFNKAMWNRKQGGGLKIDWGSKKKLDLFSNIPGIKEAGRDVGNALIRTADEAISLAKSTADVSQNAIQRGFNALTKGGTYLKGRVDNPVVHFAVDKFIEAEGLARGEINQKLGQEYLGTLRSLSKDEYKAAFDLLNAADLNKKTITPEFMQKHGLPPKLQEFLTTHQKMMDDVVTKINNARKAAGKDPITAREAYSAMSMSGDYRKIAYLLDENGKRVKNKSGEDVVVGVIGSDRLSGKYGWTLAKIEKRMLEKTSNIEFGPVQDVTASRGSSKGTPHEAFSDALKTLGEDNPHVAALLETLREVAKDDPSNYMGMQKHTMQKKGVWGMEGRKPWETEANNATQFFENQVKYIESAYNWSHLAEAAKEVNTVLRDKDVITKQPNAIALSEKYMQNALGLNPSRLGRGIDEVFSAAGNALFNMPSAFQKTVSTSRGIANTMMLSLNESFLAIQAIQGPAGIPAMAAFLRGRGLAPKTTLLTQGLDYFVQANKTLVADKAGRELSAVDRGAIDYAKKNHIYATDMVEHNTSTQANAKYYASKVLHAPAAIIETVTRAQTFLTFVKMMDDAGVKPKDGLYEQAQRFTDQVMNNYSAMEKPPVYQALGQIGSMAYNLKSFAHNELSRWSMLAREIPATGNAMPLLTQMATTIAIAGVMGLPFYSQFEELYDYITKKMGTPRSLTLDVIKMSENLAKEYGGNYDMFKNAVSHGLPTLLGADISKRVGLSDVLPSNLSDAAFAGGSKLTGTVGALGSAIVNPDERHLKAAAVAAAPNMLAAPLKSAWYTDEKGVYSTDPDKKRELITQINGTDRLLKKIGITGINESVKRTKDYQLKQVEKAYQDIRDKAMVQISYDLSNGTPITPETIDKYFVDGQGDPSSFGASINDIAMKLNIPRDTLAMINNAASSSITKAQALNRRAYANE
jgi:hypothetical protein